MEIEEDPHKPTNRPLGLFFISFVICSEVALSVTSKLCYESPYLTGFDLMMFAGVTLFTLASAQACFY